MASYLYPGTLFANVTLATGAFTAPEALPTRYVGLNLASLANIGTILDEMSGHALYPLVINKVVPTGKRELATFTDALDTSTERQFGAGSEFTTKTIVRTLDLEDVPVAPLVVMADDFIDLFTSAEVKAITASTNAQIIKWLERLRTRGTRQIVISDNAMATKLDGLIALGLIEPNRKAVIMAGTSQS